MNKKLIYVVFILCVAMTVMIGSLAAQVHEPFTGSTGETSNEQIGTAAATELLIPVGARGLAMGGSNIATSQGIDALHWNPAGLGRLGVSAEGMFSTMSYIADINVNYGAVGIKFGGFGTIGLSIKALDFGDIPLTTVDDPEGFAGRTFSPSFVVLGLTYARAFTDAITMGGTLKIISEQMHRVNGKGFAIDLGIQYHGVAGIQGLMLGVAMKNVGPQVSFDGPGLLRVATAQDGRRPAQYYQSKASSWELPSSVEIGLSYEYAVDEALSACANASFANNNLALDSYKLGGEVVYKIGTSLTVAGRGGIDLLNMDTDDEQIFGPTFGAGLTYETPGVDITVDYAYRSVDFFSNNSMFSLKLGF